MVYFDNLKNLQLNWLSLLKKPVIRYPKYNFSFHFIPSSKRVHRCGRSTMNVDPFLKQSHGIFMAAHLCGAE